MYCFMCFTRMLQQQQLGFVSEQRMAVLRQRLMHIEQATHAMVYGGCVLRHRKEGSGGWGGGGRNRLGKLPLTCFFFPCSCSSFHPTSHHPTPHHTTPHPYHN